MRHYIFAFSIFALIVDSYSSLSIFEECIRDSAISKGTQTILNAGDAQMKCYEACVLRKQGIMINRKIDVDASFDSAKKRSRRVLSDLRKIVTLCAEKANAQNSECEVASVMKNCMGEA